MEILLGLVLQDIQGILAGFVGLLVFPVFGNDFSQFRMFLGKGSPFILVRNDRRIAELVLQRDITGFHAVQFISLHCITFNLHIYKAAACGRGSVLQTGLCLTARLWPLARA